MPQVDLETLVSACAGGSSDRKIACETLADNDNNNPSHEPDRPQVTPDSPPESVWLTRNEEFDWWERNAVYERKESTKGNSNSNSTNLNPHSNSNSQRFSLNLKSKAAIIGLPKPQKPSFVDAKNRRCHKPGSARLFPKRTASIGKSETGWIEPSSPKVSCMGKVRSKRDRNRKLRTRQRSCSESATAQETAQEKSARSERRKSGFFESFRAIFRSGRRENTVQKSDPSPPVDSLPRRKSKNTKPSGADASLAESDPRNSLSENEPPGLGGMMRFASGRRSESWGLGDSEIHVA